MTKSTRSKFKDIFEQTDRVDPTLVEGEEHSTPAKAPARSSKPLAKSKDPNYAPTTVYLRKDTYQNVQIRLLAMGRRREVSELVGELLEGWLEM